MAAVTTRLIRMTVAELHKRKTQPPRLIQPTYFAVDYSGDIEIWPAPTREIRGLQITTEEASK